MFNQIQLFIIACILAVCGIAIIRYCWLKNKELMQYGLYVGNSKFKKREWDAQKDEITLYIRLYNIFIFFGIALFAIAIYLVILLDYATGK